MRCAKSGGTLCAEQAARGTATRPKLSHPNSVQRSTQRIAMMTLRSDDFGIRSRRRAAHPKQRPYRRIRCLATAYCTTIASALLSAAAIADGAGANFPHADTLLSAQQDDANWILPAKTYAGNRFTALTQIDRTNVGALGKAWRTDIADDGEQEAAPIVW